MLLLLLLWVRPDWSPVMDCSPDVTSRAAISAWIRMASETSQSFTMAAVSTASAKAHSAPKSHSSARLRSANKGLPPREGQRAARRALTPSCGPGSPFWPPPWDFERRKFCESRPLPILRRTRPKSHKNSLERPPHPNLEKKFANVLDRASRRPPLRSVADGIPTCTWRTTPSGN